MADDEIKDFSKREQAQLDSYEKKLTTLQDKLNKLYGEMKITREEMEKITEKIKENRKMLQEQGDIQENEISKIDDLIENALDSMDSIEEKDLFEVARYSKPHPRIQHVLEAVLFVMTGKKLDWKQARKELVNDFVDRVLDINWDKLSTSTLNTLKKKYFDHELWDIKKISLASNALGPLAKFMNGKFSVVEEEKKQNEKYKSNGLRKKRSERNKLIEDRFKYKRRLKKQKNQEKEIQSDMDKVKGNRQTYMNKLRKQRGLPVKSAPNKKRKSSVISNKKDYYTEEDYLKMKKDSPNKINYFKKIFYNGKLVSIEQYEKLTTKRNTKKKVSTSENNKVYYTAKEYERIKASGKIGINFSKKISYNHKYYTIEEYENMKKRRRSTIRRYSVKKYLDLRKSGKLDSDLSTIRIKYNGQEVTVEEFEKLRRGSKRKRSYRTSEYERLKANGQKIEFDRQIHYYGRLITIEEYEALKLKRNSKTKRFSKSKRNKKRRDYWKQEEYTYERLKRGKEIDITSKIKYNNKIMTLGEYERIRSKKRTGFYIGGRFYDIYDYHKLKFSDRLKLSKSDRVFYNGKIITFEEFEQFDYDSNRSYSAREYEWRKRNKYKINTKRDIVYEGNRMSFGDYDRLPDDKRYFGKFKKLDYDYYTINDYKRYKQFYIQDLDNSKLIYSDGRFISIKDYERTRYNYRKTKYFNKKYFTKYEYERLKRKGDIDINLDKVITHKDKTMTIHEYELMSSQHTASFYYKGKFITYNHYNSLKVGGKLNATENDFVYYKGNRYSYNEYHKLGAKYDVNETKREYERNKQRNTRSSITFYSLEDYEYLREHDSHKIDQSRRVFYKGRYMRIRDYEYMRKKKGINKKTSVKKDYWKLEHYKRKKLRYESDIDLNQKIKFNSKISTVREYEKSRSWKNYSFYYNRRFFKETDYRKLKYSDKLHITEFDRVFKDGQELKWEEYEQQDRNANRNYTAREYEWLKKNKYKIDNKRGIVYEGKEMSVKEYESLPESKRYFGKYKKLDYDYYTPSEYKRNKYFFRSKLNKQKKVNYKGSFYELKEYEKLFIEKRKLKYANKKSFNKYEYQKLRRRGNIQIDLTSSIEYKGKRMSLREYEQFRSEYSASYYYKRSFISKERYWHLRRKGKLNYDKDDLIFFKNEVYSFEQYEQIFKNEKEERRFAFDQLIEEDDYATEDEDIHYFESKEEYELYKREKQTHTNLFSKIMLSDKEITLEEYELDKSYKTASVFYKGGFYSFWEFYDQFDLNESSDFDDGQIFYKGRIMPLEDIDEIKEEIEEEEEERERQLEEGLILDNDLSDEFEEEDIMTTIKEDDEFDDSEEEVVDLNRSWNSEKESKELTDTDIKEDRESGDRMDESQRLLNKEEELFDIENIKSQSEEIKNQTINTRNSEEGDLNKPGIVNTNESINLEQGKKQTNKELLNQNESYNEKDNQLRTEQKELNQITISNEIDKIDINKVITNTEADRKNVNKTITGNEFDNSGTDKINTNKEADKIYNDKTITEDRAERIDKINVNNRKTEDNQMSINKKANDLRVKPVVTNKKPDNPEVKQKTIENKANNSKANQIVANKKRVNQINTKEAYKNDLDIKTKTNTKDMTQISKRISKQTESINQDKAAELPAITEGEFLTSKRTTKINLSDKIKLKGKEITIEEYIRISSTKETAIYYNKCLYDESKFNQLIKEKKITNLESVIVFYGGEKIDLNTYKQVKNSNKPPLIDEQFKNYTADEFEYLNAFKPQSIRNDFKVYYNNNYMDQDKYQNIKSSFKEKVLYDNTFLSIEQYEKERNNKKANSANYVTGKVFYNGKYITQQEYEHIKHELQGTVCDCPYKERVFYKGEYISIEKYEQIKEENKRKETYKTSLNYKRVTKGSHFIENPEYLQKHKIKNRSHSYYGAQQQGVFYVDMYKDCDCANNGEDKERD